MKVRAFTKQGIEIFSQHIATLRSNQPSELPEDLLSSARTSVDFLPDIEIDETLKLTNLGMLVVNDTVNFERSVTFGTELGGHIVSGHIHCMAEILSINHHQDNCKMQLALAKEWQKYVLYKGFVSVNGASLTVGEVGEQGFWLHLIPETLSITNLDNYREGDKLNIEVDQQTYTIINTVENYLSQQAK